MAQAPGSGLWNWRRVRRVQGWSLTRAAPSEPPHKAETVRESPNPKPYLGAPNLGTRSSEEALGGPKVHKLGKPQAYHRCVCLLLCKGTGFTWYRVYMV